MIGVRAGRAKLGPVTLADLIPTQDGEAIWDAALGSAIGQQHDADGGEFFDLFTGWAADRGLPLYPAQEEALLEIVAGANVILDTPTGSGKSLVATAAHFAALARAAVLLHGADQGAGVGEVLRPVRHLRRRRRRHAHRRRRGQRRRAGHLLHGRDPGQHGAARRRATPTSARW